MVVKNKEALKHRIKTSGLRPWYVSAQLGMASITLHKKINGSLKFHEAEIERLVALLALTEVDKLDIFGAEEVNNG